MLSLRKVKLDFKSILSDKEFRDNRTDEKTRIKITETVKEINKDLEVIIPSLAKLYGFTLRDSVCHFESVVKVNLTANGPVAGEEKVYFHESICSPVMRDPRDVVSWLISTIVSKFESFIANSKIDRSNVIVYFRSPPKIDFWYEDKFVASDAIKGYELTTDVNYSGQMRFVLANP